MITFKPNNMSKEEKREWIHIMNENSDILAKAQVGEPCFNESLGWLDTERHADDEHIKRIEEIAHNVNNNSDVFVLIGVGGSNNAARSVVEALQDGKSAEIVYAGNTLSANAINRMIKQLEGRDYTIDCIAKNFETLEPGAAFRVLRCAMDKKYGEASKERIIATGTFNSSLETLCREEGYTFIDFPLDVGGRYTAVTNVGLLPMAVAGIDIRAVRDGARDMEHILRDGSISPEKNLAYQYACLRNLYFRKGFKVEMLSSFEPQFHWFYQWWIQLFAESEGKAGLGLFPVTGEFSEQLHSIGQYIQDGAPIMFETFLNVSGSDDSCVISCDGRKDYFDYINNKDFKDINNIDFQATLLAHSDKLPCSVLQIDHLDAYHFGLLFYFFEFSCYLSCRIMGLNPFDQPGVEAYKKRMFEALGKPEHVS